MTQQMDMAEQEKVSSFAEKEKNPLKARRFYGFSLMQLGALAEIATGDPISLNGFIKMSLWVAGSGLLVAGILDAKQKLTWRIYRRSLDE